VLYLLYTYALIYAIRRFKGNIAYFLHITG
jgi:hypothetical protein